MTLEQLKEIREKNQNRVGMKASEIDHKRVVVGVATCGIASGSMPVLEKIREEIKNQGIDDVEVAQTGCIGLCQYEPIVEVFEPGKDKVTYIKMTAEKAQEVVEKHLKNGAVVSEYTVSSQKI